MATCGDHDPTMTTIVAHVQYKCCRALMPTKTPMRAPLKRGSVVLKFERSALVRPQRRPSPYYLDS